VDGERLFEVVAECVNSWGEKLVGERGYSSVGAVVGATWPEESARLRKLMPQGIFLVPGYGAQGVRAADVKPCFHSDRFGAVVNSSRGIIFAHQREPWKSQLRPEQWPDAVEAAAREMVDDLRRIWE